MIDILFFAELRDVAGKEKITVDAAGLTVKELKDKWLSSYNFTNIDHAMIAVNEEYAEDDTVLANGDIVAFIPPVSGG